jgi:cephalosporin-C deacetylase-like acetyl esterase
MLYMSLQCNGRSEGGGGALAGAKALNPRKKKLIPLYVS